MDDITRHKVSKETERFIESIDPAAVCDLASSYHPDKQRCWIFDEKKKGGFNVCFPVEFAGGQDGTAGERWMVRVPLLPRLAFPEEKFRSEIATMKFIAEKTTIPIPRLIGYSLNKDNPLGAPFMLLDFIEGKSMFGVKILDLPEDERNRLLSNIGDIYIQLSQHRFDRIGALTLDSDENWVFDHNRPLSVLMNEQSLAGLDPCRHIGLNQTFHSTMDYIYMIHQALFDDFYKRRDSIKDENDARGYLYSLHETRRFLMEWVDPKYNHGPFFLMHGDLRSANILVDDDLNIVSVLDWEWSHTIPAQMFLPPSWLTGLELIGAVKGISRVLYQSYVFMLQMETRRRERGYYPECRDMCKLPLAKIWEETLEKKNLFIGLGMMQPRYFGNIYWYILEHSYYGKEIDNHQKRVDDFFSLEVHKPELEAVQKKVQEISDFKKECDTLGVEVTAWITEESDKPLKKNPESVENSPPPPSYRLNFDANRLVELLDVSTRWKCVGAAVLSICCLMILRKRW
ncbi:hypothetical protein MferCBS31731_002466 [Microsporum ferrugineum]